MSVAVDSAWLDFLEIVSGKSDGSWVFRGQGDSLWTLQPKIGRPGVSGPAGYRQAEERRLFDDFRREAQRFERGLGFDDLDWLALAQHHGLPTRLLDWTFNPMTAAWFAVADEANSADASIHMLRFLPHSLLAKSSDPFALVAGPILTRVPPLAARVTSQQGLFSIHPEPTSAWLPTLPFDYATFAIPGASKAAFRSMLHLMGFNWSRLMSDLDGLCKTLDWQHRIAS